MSELNNVALCYPVVASLNPRLTKLTAAFGRTS